MFCVLRTHKKQQFVFGPYEDLKEARDTCIDLAADADVYGEHVSDHWDTGKMTFTIDAHDVLVIKTLLHVEAV